MTTYTLEGTLAGFTPLWFGDSTTVTGTLERAGPDGPLTDIRIQIPAFDPFTDLNSPPDATSIFVSNDDGYALFFNSAQGGPNGRLIDTNLNPNAPLATAMTIEIHCTNDCHPVPAPEIGSGVGAILAIALLGARLWRRA